MSKRSQIYLIVAIFAVVLVNLPVRHCLVRWDLTDDQRYTLSDATRQLLRSTTEPVTVTLCLEGDLNSGFRRLRSATKDILQEMGQYADIRTISADEHDLSGLAPITIHEREQNGKTVQTTVYPYAIVRYRDRSAVVTLLHNRRGLSGEENLNQSIEALEYAFAEALYSTTVTKTPAIAFLEGHGELPEQNVWDLEQELSKYFRIDRGTIGTDPAMLDSYRCVIIADPQTPFSETDRYILDHYLMQGGRILWCLNGVQFSNNILSSEGFTPVIALDLNLKDMHFQYGFRIEPVLVQDVQCLPIPVNVAAENAEANYQPMPWFYAPLLLTSEASPITRSLGQVSSTFASLVRPVGGDDGIKKDILLATSEASRVIGTPAEVNLSDLHPDPTEFKYQFMPVALSLEGSFPSAYRHLDMPKEIQGTPVHYERSEPTRQVVIASGSIIRNEVQRGQALPLGYDRYSGMQFSNRDFLVQSVLWLTDDADLISLRAREVALRLLNDKRAHEHRLLIQWISTLTPIALLAFIGLMFLLIHRRKYTR